MAINKSSSPLWVKVVLIVLIVAFVLSFITIVANPFQASTTQDPAQTAQNPTAQADAQYQPAVAALTNQLQSDPTSYTVLVNLGNTYFDWAVAKQQASSTTTSAVGADQPYWISAKDAYARALAVNAKESPVRVDHSITVYYSGDVFTAIKLAEGVAKDDPKFAPAQFNLGIFYKTAGDNKKAVAAFKKYIALDPQGTTGNLQFAKDQLKELEAAAQ